MANAINSLPLETFPQWQKQLTVYLWKLFMALAIHCLPFETLPKWQIELNFSPLETTKW